MRLKLLEKKVAWFDLPKENVSVDFKEFASKFGVNMKMNISLNRFLSSIKRVKSVTFKFSKTVKRFDLEEFKMQSFALINQKQKGYTYEKLIKV